MDKKLIDNENLIKKMIETAAANIEKSYAPYSNFNVSAAILMGSGKIYTGVNVENSSYGVTLCAERNAIGHAVAEGERKLDMVVIVGGKEGRFTDYCVPCGMCRQFMREFGDPKEIKIICARSVTDYKLWTLEELLPESFGPEFLGKQHILIESDIK